MFKTPWAIWCKYHDEVFLTYREYVEQMSKPNSRWECPLCGATSGWVDKYLEEYEEDPEAWIKVYGDPHEASSYIEDLL